MYSISIQNTVLIGRGARHTCVGVQPATSWFRDDVDVVTLIKHNPAHVGQIAQVEHIHLHANQTLTRSMCLLPDLV